MWKHELLIIYPGERHPLAVQMDDLSLALRRMENYMRQMPGLKVWVESERRKN